jgi:hypothetical protein
VQDFETLAFVHERRILQNIATSNPGLSGLLRFLPLDQPLELIMAVRGDHCWALRFYPPYAFSYPRSLTCGASVERVPLVGEGILLVCVQPHSNARWLPPWFGMPTRGKNVIPCLILLCDCGEDGGGIPPFVAGYGALRSWPSPDLGSGERRKP